MSSALIFGLRGPLPRTQIGLAEGGTCRRASFAHCNQGPEEHYKIGEELAADMFAPILRRHRVTIEQMAVLEPAVVESPTFATCITVLRDAMETAVAMGVPKQAAWDFCPRPYSNRSRSFSDLRSFRFPTVR